MSVGPTSIKLAHGDLHLPTFFPDATVGVVRALDSSDLERCGIQGVVMNTFHLMQRPGSSTVQALGGLHAMAGWPHPIITDSGGFQAFSLVRENPKFGQITNKGISFQPEGADRRYQLTPEKTVQLQMSYGTDVVICLDDVTHVDDPIEVQQTSVQRTIAWARRGKAEFQRLVEQKRLSLEQRPLLFGVVQGGGSYELRRYCAEELMAVGFDGFGYGGFPLDSEGNLLTDIFAYLRELIPKEFPLHALGVGHPVNVVECARLGYGIFDSALPTRDARRGRLYVVRPDSFSSSGGSTGDWFKYLYIEDKKHIKRNEPISPTCDCLCCSRYSLGYLHHLFEINDFSYLRLSTIHNLRVMVQLTERLQGVFGDALKEPPR